MAILLLEVQGKTVAESSSGFFWNYTYWTNRVEGGMGASNSCIHFYNCRLGIRRAPNTRLQNINIE
jgi:hypothetical protein